LNTERIWAINSHIQMKGQVHLKELMELFPQVSAMTIRRDIDYLEKQGHIVRTRGGAKSIIHLTHMKEDIYQTRANERIEAKTAIAQKAAGLTLETGAVYFDSGSTVMHTVMHMNVTGIFAVTSGPNVALELCRRGCARTVLLGGNVNMDNLSISGVSALEQLKKINIGTAFMAASGFASGTGFTVGNFDEGELKRAAIAKASKVAVLMDSEKIGSSLPYTFASFSDIDCLISEYPLPKELYEEAVKSGVTVL